MSFRHPRDFQYSPSSSSPVSLTDIALTSPIVPPAIITDSPPLHRNSLPSANAPNSPYTTEDEDDESNWDDDTVSDSGTTASSDSPWPRSPLQGRASLSPAVKHSIHNDVHDDDDDETGLVMSQRVRQSIIPPELPVLPPDLSNFHDHYIRFATRSAVTVPYTNLPSGQCARYVGSSVFFIPCNVSNRIYVCSYFLPAPCLLAKPLISRENQFHEAVEREAPPVLGYIPRYLGVMLVTYPRVKSSEHSPTGLEDRR